MALDAAGFVTRLLIGILATWRVTYLLTYEDGPGEVFARVRAALGRGWIGRMLDCFNCLSLWIAAPVALWLTTSPTDWWWAWLAVSGGACLCERLGAPGVTMTRIGDANDGDDDDLLRPTH